MTTTTQAPINEPTADRLALMLFIATAFHALIILGVSFDVFDVTPPQDNMPTLDITVVNAASTKPPEEADYLAETSQDGGGNTDQQIQPQQQKVEQAPPPAAESQNTPQSPQVLTRVESTQKQNQPEEPAPEQKSEQPSATELVNRSMEMLSLNEQINQSMLIYSKAPKSKYITSRTREFKYASYMRDWVTKVERVGELNYPDTARRNKLSGSLIVKVALDPDGSVRDISVLRPSGHKLLDDAAIRIVRLAAPYPPFPESIRKETDVLHITRTWIFTSGNQLKGR